MIVINLVKNIFYSYGLVMKYSKVLFAVSFWLFVLALFNPVMYAGVTGKIHGKVIDKKTHEPLPGVNIIIEGTLMGAATDFNGEYFILQVPPGNYTLKASMVGYQAVIVKDVRVIVDHTTSINFELEEQSIQLKKEVVVTAKRPIIQKDVTSSTQFIEARQLTELPITDTKQGLMVQAGVFLDPIPVVGGLGSAGRGEVRFSVRGGSQDQVKWYVDGVRMSTLVAGRADWGTKFDNINLNAVQEIQMMTGGFNAEYGEAESGIINVVTKEGADQFHGSAEYIYGVPGQHHFGNYLYDRYTEKEFLDHTLPNGQIDPNWLTPYRQSQIYDYRKIPDNTINLSLSGPLFKLNGNAVRFFLSGQIESLAYDLPHPRDTKNNDNMLFNFAYQNKSSKLKLEGIYNHYAYSTLQENGEFTNQAKYYRGWGSLLDLYTYNLSANWTDVITQKLFYELKLSYFFDDFHEGPSPYTVLGQSLHPTLFGFERYNGYENEPFDQYAPVIKNHIGTGDISLVGDVNWQFDDNNLVKAGFEFRYDTYAEYENTRYPSFTTDPRYWINRGLDQTYHPLQFSGYLQDKMEFESMILNVGVRLDYFDPNRNWFVPTNLFNLAIDPLYNQAKDPDLDQVDSAGHVKYSFQNVLNKPMAPAKSYLMISPRFGVSFPITENTLLHFNYGHFYQLPPLDEMFEFLYFRPVNLVQAIMQEDQLAQQQGRAPRHIPSNDGDPERVTAYTVEPLKPQKTVMFEVGVKHNFNDIAVLDVTAYYKDSFNQTSERVGLFDRFIYGYNPFTNQVSPNQSFTSYLPGDYGDSRGIEVTLRTLFSKLFTVDLNYSFSRATTGRASPRTVTFDQYGNITYQWDTDVNKRIPVEESFSRPQMLRANLYVRFPDELGEKFPLNLLKGTSASFLYSYISGQAFTYLTPTDPPDTYDNYRYPPYQSVDFRFDKNIVIAGIHNFDFYVRITNLFNAKNVQSIGDVVFDANAIKKYVDTGQVSTVDAGGYDISWQTYYETRRFYLGVKYSF